MSTIELKDRLNSTGDIKFSQIYFQFRELLNELRKKELPANILASIHESVETLNASFLTGEDLRKLVKQKQTALLKQLEKELKIIPKSYYQNLGTVLGISGIGVPIGVAFGLSIGNMGLLGLGLPIGMGIGTVIGLAMDKKALNEGRQLNTAIKY